MKKMAALVEGRYVLLQGGTYHRNWLKLLHKRILYKKRVEIQLKRPREPSFLLEQLERGQVAMRPG